MKKTVIIILAILPIVLVIAIAFAGRIISIYRLVPVEKVSFVNTLGDEMGPDDLFTVNVGETKSSNIRIYPELASNKAVSYVCSDESVCTVDGEGNITGISLGLATIMVKTYDGNKTALMTVKVTADKVTGVSLNATELELFVGSSYNLSATVNPYSAIDKSVTFASDNSSVVSVSGNGKLSALSPGTATITVTTNDGGFAASCTVTVSDSRPPISFDFDGVDGVSAGGEGYIVTLDTLDLKEYIVLADSISLPDVRFEIVSGSSSAALNNGVITFSRSGVITVAIYTGDPSSPSNRLEIRLLHP